MKVALCDDEQNFLNDLTNLIKDVCEAEITEFSGGEEFLSDFCANKYDVIFLDIEMSKIDGITTAKIIRETDPRVIIVFVTSHKEFALDGYEVNAYRYILKGQPKQLYIEQLRSVYNEYRQRHLSFGIKSGTTALNIAVEEIIYFEVFKRIILLHTTKEKYEFYGKLSEIEKDKRLIDFIKPHKSYYINLAYIERIENNTITMKNANKIPLSRNFANSVTDKFVAYITEGC